MKRSDWTVLVLATIVWAVVAVLYIVRTDPTHEAALAENGALRRQLQVAKDEVAAMARHATAQGDSAMMARAWADSVTRAERAEKERARRAGKMAADSLRATLDSVQAVLLDSLQAAHADEVAALEEEVAAVRWELERTRWAWDAERDFRVAETARADAAETLVAHTDGLWRAAEREAQKAGRAARVWRGVALVAAGVAAWERVW
ncbi:MAG: hypothetical protein AMXMBFR53_36520 [Gemmatimonadota bacterium]